MSRCVGQVVIIESPTIPILTQESLNSPAYTPEAGALKISVGDISLCACGEVVAITTVLYDGNFFYDGEAIFSATLA